MRDLIIIGVSLLAVIFIALIVVRRQKKSQQVFEQHIQQLKEMEQKKLQQTSWDAPKQRPVPEQMEQSSTSQDKVSKEKKKEDIGQDSMDEKLRSAIPLSDPDAINGVPRTTVGEEIEDASDLVALISDDSDSDTGNVSDDSDSFPSEGLEEEVNLLKQMMDQKGDHDTGPISQAALVDPIEPKAYFPHATLQDLSYCTGQRTIDIDKPVIRIGRQKGMNDIVIPKRTVSKQHARIEYKNDMFYLVDLRSANGSYLNFMLISDRHKMNEVPLKNSDRIAFDEFEFLFFLEEEENVDQTLLRQIDIPMPPPSKAKGKKIDPFSRTIKIPAIPSPSFEELQKEQLDAAEGIPLSDSQPISDPEPESESPVEPITDPDAINQALGDYDLVADSIPELEETQEDFQPPPLDLPDIDIPLEPISVTDSEEMEIPLDSSDEFPIVTTAETSEESETAEVAEESQSRSLLADDSAPDPDNKEESSPEPNRERRKEERKRLTTNCYNHPNRKAPRMCSACGHNFCMACITEKDGEIICKDCAAMDEPGGAPV